MKRTFLLLATMLATVIPSLAENAPAAFGFTNAPVSEVLDAYQKISGLDLVIDTHVRRITNYTTLASTPADTETRLKLIEAVLQVQARVIVTRLDDHKRASVTVNDALPSPYGLIDPNASLKPYSETADAKLDLKQALARADAAKTPVIVVFGANWCPDCKMLESAMRTGAVAPLMARDFQIVKVNTGGFFDKNLDLAATYGVPLDSGIPAVVILSPKNEVLYATRSGELASAKKMGDQGIYDFFLKVTASPALKH